MAQPFRITDGDDPGRDLGGWDEDGNVDMPGTLTVDAIRASGTGTVDVDSPGEFAGVRIPPGIMLPQDHGLECWSHDPFYPASSVIAINGRVYAIKLPVRRTVDVDTLWWSVATAGLTPTAGQNEVGLYDAAGTKLASTNVDADISSTGGKATAITRTRLFGGTYVRVLFLFNAATAPTLVRGSSFESAPNLNLSAADFRSAVVSSAQTALPSSFTPGNLTTSNALTFFAGIEAA